MDWFSENLGANIDRLILGEISDRRFRKDIIKYVINKKMRSLKIKGK
jgi:hypothetical protein